MKNEVIHGVSDSNVKGNVNLDYKEKIILFVRIVVVKLKLMQNSVHHVEINLIDLYFILICLM